MDVFLGEETDRSVYTHDGALSAPAFPVEGREVLRSRGGLSTDYHSGDHYDEVVSELQRVLPQQPYRLRW
jgi:hypothetical protein